MNKVILHIFAVLTFILISSPLYSQQFEDVVYLKNGGEVHGLIIEQIPNESVKIKTKDGNIFVYKMDEIEKITKGETTKQPAYEKKEDENISRVNNYRQYDNKGLQFVWGGGAGIGIGPEENFGLGLHAHLGGLFSKNFGVLIDLESNNYTGWGDINPMLVTIRAEGIVGSLGRYDRISFYGRAGVGYSFFTSTVAVGDDGSGYIGAGVGYNLLKSAVCIEPGYTFFFGGDGMFTLKLTSFFDLY